MEALGTVEILQRYPVKSMRGEELASAHVDFSGVVGDRIYAFVDATRAADFPWHSARQRADMLLYTPAIQGSAAGVHYVSPAVPHVVVTTPAGRALPIGSPELLQEIAGAKAADVSLRYSDRGMHDARPLSLFGLETARRLAEECGRPLDPLRFRANVYVRWASGEPFFEDTLLGKQLRIGERLEVMIVKKDPRCQIVSLDPTNAESHPEVLRSVGKLNRGCAGVYAAVLRSGDVRKGDPIVLIQ